MAEKKPRLGATVPPPDQKADFYEQLRQTFERGVVSAEIDLGGTLNKQAAGGLQARAAFGPRSVWESAIRKAKEIAAAYGGKFTVHAPAGELNPAGTMEIERTRSAQLLKQTLEYAAKVNSPVVVVHPLGSMGYGFLNPIIGSFQGVDNPFKIAKDEKELEKMMDMFNIKDQLLREQIKKEWENWVHTLPHAIAQQAGALTLETRRAFEEALFWRTLGKLWKESGGNVEEFARKALQKLGDDRRVVEILRNIQNNRDLQKHLEWWGGNEGEKRFKFLWARANLASPDPIRDDGRPAIGEDAEKVRKDAWKVLMENVERIAPGVDTVFREEIRDPKTGKIIGVKRKKMKVEDALIEYVKDTFRRLLSDPDVKRLLQQKKITIALENLFPAHPEKGYMQGFAAFYTPEQMAKLIKELKAIAKAQGIPEDRIGLTFDVGHAAAAAHVTGMKPSEFIDKLKKLGVKITHAHIVGGPGYGHQHEAWGDFMDEVHKMDPKVVEKLAEAGVINIEGADINDIETTLNALWDQGAPVEAILAIAAAPDRALPTLRAMGYAEVPSYWSDLARTYASTGFVRYGFYSFQAPALGMPGVSYFGSYFAPAMYGGGYGFGQRPSTFWSSSQPLLYSSKRGGEE